MAAALATVVAVGVAVGTAPGSRAQDGADEFRNGTAKAVAVVTKVAPGVGSLELAMDQGIAVSQVTNALAQAQSQAVDLGLIGTSLTAEGCGDPYVRPDQLPQPVRVDNRQGDASASSDELPAGPGGSAGRLQASATTRPSAQAIATMAASGVDGLISLGGGKATADSAVIPGEAREARGVVEVDLDIAGAVQLRGMRWTARHRTGSDPAAVGTFEVAEAAVGGVPLPLEDLEAAQDAVNAALEATGITVELPRVERMTEPVDFVRVTPLRIALDRSPLARTLLGPGLDATRDGRVQMFDVVTEMICETGPILFVADIVTSVFAGTGFLALEVGGVEASSGDLVLSNPFGEIEPAMELPAAVDVPEVGGGPAAGGAGSPPAGTVPAAGAPAEQVTAPAPVAATGPIERLCESVHPFRWPSCSEGAAVPLGLLGLAATAAMAALDWRHQRRLLAAPAPAGTVAT
jgi:hypothetical protein